MKIVIALGGNALGNTPLEQLELITKTVKPIVGIIEQGHQIVLTHGNGPQVGMIHLGMASAAETGKIKSAIPFPECGAMSQGYIGFHLQCAIYNGLRARGIVKAVATVVTQVLVDEDDKAFDHPSKPIGAFYTKEQAEVIARERGITMKEDAGRGYRQVVPSPMPVDIVEKDFIQALVNGGNIVIAAGGGGIPVVSRNDKLEGVPAVIDKDAVSAKLAEILKADILVILTAVERVAINYGKPDMKDIAEMSVVEAQEFCEQGHFAPGSMLPKVQAAIAFAKTGKTSIIASLQNAPDALIGKSGTRVLCKKA